MVYEPAEDSFLLQKFVRKYARGLVLDMGTGSGIQAETAAETADAVIGLDVDKEAIKHCKKEIRRPNVQFFKSNLFQIFDEYFFLYNPADKIIEVYDPNDLKDPEERKIAAQKQIKFDLIIFNPPYLPQEKKRKEIDLEGGNQGYEVIERFFRSVKNYLKKDGRIVLVFSSLTNKTRVNEFIHKAGMRYIELEKQHIFFEDLYVYYVTKL